jgi:hypothetical protein
VAGDLARAEGKDDEEKCGGHDGQGSEWGVASVLDAVGEPQQLPQVLHLETILAADFDVKGWAGDPAGVLRHDPSVGATVPVAGPAVFSQSIALHIRGGFERRLLCVADRDAKDCVERERIGRPMRTAFRCPWHALGVASLSRRPEHRRLRPVERVRLWTKETSTCW